MKKILAVLFLLASICSAQVETGGLTIPGDGAVQVVRKAAAGPYPWSDSTIAYEFMPQNYDYATGGIAIWTNTGFMGGVASQSVEVYKPLMAPAGEKRVVFKNNNSNIGIKVAVSSLRPISWVFVIGVTNAYIINYSGSAGYFRFDYRTGGVFRHFDSATYAYTPSTLYGVHVLTVGPTGVIKIYHDKTLYYTSGATNTGGFPQPELRFGHSAYNNGFKGHYNCFLGYQKELSQADVDTLTDQLYAYFGADNISRALP